MPSILNPLPDEANPAAKTDAVPTSTGKDAQHPASRGGSRDIAKEQMLTGQAEPEGPQFKNDLEQFAFEDLQIDKMLIHTVAARTKQPFFDPHAPLKEEHNNTARSNPGSDNGDDEPHSRYYPEPEDPTANFKYRLGRSHFKDTLNGDTGCLLKKPDLCPNVSFVRAAYCAKSSAKNSHRELAQMGK